MLLNSQLLPRECYLLRGIWLLLSVCRITEKDEGDALELLRIIWTNTIIRMPKTEVDEILRGPPGSIRDPDTEIQSSSGILFVAAEMGNTRFVIELLRTYPDLIWKVNDDIAIKVSTTYCTR